MAKLTTGLAYCPLDCLNSRKIKSFIYEFGNKGFGVYIRLMQEIYGKEGYYMSVDKYGLLSLAEEYNVGYSSLCEIIRGLIRYGIYDEQMYDKNRILTSDVIQKYYLHAKRTDIQLNKNYILDSIIPYIDKMRQFAGKKQEKAQRKEKKIETDNNYYKGESDCITDKEIQSDPQIQKFSKIYPLVYVDTQYVPNYVDIDKLIEHYKINTWLHGKNNITLKWLFQQKNYNKVIADCYKGDVRQITIKTQHNEDLSYLYDTIDEIEV